ncbi:hypothetical protein [Suttonella ornithocola]|uniref:Uncharacterized protein n=1 Tax=Suttonella ornithocola TaxID=279832 RepID=A0A380MXR4_9GAMM|nr:hypothetical protein [Suttonella ornithocola]SUO97349.1 Uncharacterised protein [Suttonella ornithocola]
MPSYGLTKIILHDSFIRGRRCELHCDGHTNLHGKTLPVRQAYLTSNPSSTADILTSSFSAQTAKTAALFSITIPPIVNTFIALFATMLRARYSPNLPQSMFAQNTHYQLAELKLHVTSHSHREVISYNIPVRLSV